MGRFFPQTPFSSRGLGVRRASGAEAGWEKKRAYTGLPFQIGAAEGCFVRPLVKVSKTGSHPFMDDCPINQKLSYQYAFKILLLKVNHFQYLLIRIVGSIQ